MNTESFIQTCLKIVEKVHGDLPDTEDDCADSDHYDQVGDVGVGDILLWLGLTQQAGQETVPFVHSVAWRIQEIW